MSSHELRRFLVLVFLGLAGASGIHDSRANTFLRSVSAGQTAGKTMTTSSVCNENPKSSNATGTNATVIR